MKLEIIFNLLGESDGARCYFPVFGVTEGQDDEHFLEGQVLIVDCGVLSNLNAHSETLGVGSESLSSATINVSRKLIYQDDASKTTILVGLPMSVLASNKILEVCLELGYDLCIIASAEPPLVLFGTSRSIQTAIKGRSEPEK